MEDYNIQCSHSGIITYLELCYVFFRKIVNYGIILVCMALIEDFLMVYIVCDFI